MGISLSDMDDITVGFLIEILQQNYSDKDEEIIEATPEMIARL